MGDGIGPRTLDVPLDWTLPTLGRRLVPPGARVDVADESSSNTVHDTSGRDLESAGVALTRASGAWVLRIGDDTSTYPVSGRGVPAEIRDLLLGVRTGAALRPVRRVDTGRTTHRVIGPDGAEIGEIVVVRERTAEGGAAATVGERARVEVAAWDGPFVDAVVRRLVKAGAVERTGTSEPADHATVGAALRAHLRDQHEAILLADLGLRRGDDTVHRFRVAVRRTRSALRVVQVVQPEPAADLDAELKWLSGLLGAVRNYQMLRDHLAAGADDEPDLDLTAAHEFVGAVLTRDEQAARADLVTAMAGRRYLALLRSVRDWRAAPPFTAKADRPVERLAHYVRAADRDLDKKLAKAKGSPSRLHTARKAAKRARYVATFAGPAAGKHRSDIVRRAKALQRRLGDHQDCIVAAEFLERVGVEATGAAAFGCGVLWGREQRRAERLAAKVS